MTSKVLDIKDILEEDQLAVKISDQWLLWDTLRHQWKMDKEEVRKYVYATDTTQTSNSSLPWKNKTTIPKLCHIRDNLYSNYTSVLFPQRKWLIWEANEYDSNSAQKRDAIVNYMAWAIEQPSFKHEIDKIILDYIDFGNCFATVEWIDERVVQPDGRTQTGYIGPGVRRIDPLSITMNPTAESFPVSPKIIKTLVSKGELKKILESMSTDENKEEYAALFQYLTEIRRNAAEIGEGDWVQKDTLYLMDGFSSFRDYLMSDYVEILTFYGDLYDPVNDELLSNHVITVVDRHKLIGKKPNPSFFGTPPIFHAPWRKRQDNLWGMGPLDNLVGMQYRLDHVENMRADVVDLTTYPVQIITGFVEDYLWQPGAKIYASDEGKVELLQPQVQVLNANFELGQLEAKMEEIAGAPKEAMGFRTPGEKTKYEVQSLQNAASRVFQNKIKQFEEQIIEPLLNAMLELARRNLTGATVIKVFDDDLKVAAFESLSVQDITGVGRIRPIAARHFAEQANLIQNLTNLAGSGLWPMVQPHFSGIKLAKLFENAFDICDYEIVMPYIALAEQADAQKFAGALSEQVMMALGTPTGRGYDYDLGRVNYSQIAQQAQQQEQQQAQQVQPGQQPVRPGQPGQPAPAGAPGQPQIGQEPPPQTQLRDTSNLQSLQSTGAVR